MRYEERMSRCAVAAYLIACVLWQSVVTSAQGAPPDAVAGARWVVRDVAAGTDWSETANALRVETKTMPGPTTWASAATVTDTSGKDRAVTLAFAVPLDAAGWTWHDDPQKSRVIPPASTGSFSNLVDTNCGATGTASLYPIAVVSNGTHALVLAVPPEPARMVRFAYDAGRKELRAEFDFGLSADSGKFPSKADARVFVFEVESKWPFRAAIEKYWSMYPDAFARRENTPAGIWLPFGDIRMIKDPKDFGIEAHECADHQVRGADAKPFCDADAAAGCQTFPYVEPPTYWQQYNGPATDGYAERMAQLEKEAADGSAMAQSTLVSGIITADGTRDLYLGKVAYTTQAPWGSDANPDIPAGDKGWPSKGKYESDRLAQLLGWKREANPGTDGVYVDSMEGWGTILNYNKDHWRASRFPLTFDPKTKRVCLWNFWGTYSFVADMSKKLHADHKLLMANDAYFRFWFPMPHVDVPGREYTWTDKEGKLAPVPDERYLFFKSMSGRRPYLMLMNNRYEDAGIMEPYFQRSLFYAVYPSMFQGHTAMGETAYFSNPAWYDRDRPLFKKYLPLIRRLDRAGWRPVPDATTDPADVRVERYGSAETKDLAFALYNPTNRDASVTVRMDARALHLPGNATAREWIRNRAVSIDHDGAEARFGVTLPAQGYAVVGIEAK